MKQIGIPVALGIQVSDGLSLVSENLKNEAK
jgi:hypothetical protein